MNGMDTTATAPRNDATIKVLAWLAYAALGVAAFLNAVLAGVAVIGGHMIGAIGTAADQADEATIAADANHAALVAKLIGVGFGLLAATEYAAGHFIKRRIRTLFVPIAMGLTFAGELGFDIWARHFNGLDAGILVCAAFATWVWWKLPRTTPAEEYGSMRATW
jgi:hypothetical protein